MYIPCTILNSPNHTFNVLEIVYTRLASKEMASFFTRMVNSVGNTISAYTGEDSYRFGDLSRTTATRVGKSVKHYTGKDEYQFGDITRHTISSLYMFGDRHGAPAIQYMRGGVLGYTEKDRYVLGDITLSTVRRFIDLLRGLPNTDQNSCGSGSNQIGYADVKTDEMIDVLSQAFWLPNQRDVNIRCTIVKLEDAAIWDSFFVIAYELSMRCLYLGVLMVDDFTELEPFLFIGLPSLVLVEAVHRSMDHEGIVLATGIVVTAENCPDEVRDMFHAIARFKKLFSELELNSFELSWLKLTLLFATSSEKAPPVEIGKRVSADRMERVNAIRSEVIGVSILLTQMLIFKDKFGKIISRVIQEVMEID